MWGLRNATNCVVGGYSENCPNHRTARIGGGRLCEYGHLPGTIQYIEQSCMYICITSVIYLNLIPRSCLAFRRLQYGKAESWAGPRYEANQNPYLEGTESSLDPVTQCSSVVGCSPPLHCFSVHHRWRAGTYPQMYLHACVFV